MSSIMRLLFVEDNNDMREGVEIALSQRQIVIDGYKASNRSELENLFETQKFDAIVSRCALGDFTIQEALELRNERHITTPFIAVALEQGKAD